MADLSLGIRIGAALQGSFQRIFGRAKREVGELVAAEDKLGATVRRRDRILGQASSLQAQIGTAVAVGAAMAAPITAAIRFESAMADVRKVVDFETPHQFDEMRRDLLRLSKEIPITADGLADIVAEAGQAGVAREELLRFTRDAAKMSVAFDMSAGESGDKMAGLRKIFKLNQDDVVSLGDAYNHLSNNMAARARDMVKIAERVGSTGKTFGLTGEQVGALGATFLELKTPPEVAGTAIDSMLNKLSTADKQPKKFQDALDRLGLSAEELKDHIERDAQGALLSFLEAAEDSPERLGDLTDLFGAEHSDQVNKLVDGLDSYREALGLIGKEAEYAGSMQKEYASRADTTANKLTLFKNQVTSVGVIIGDKLLPPLNTVVGAWGEMIDWVVEFGEKYPVVVSAVTAIGGAFAAWKVLAILNPIGLTITAIAVLATVVWAYWEPISGFFQGLWEGVKGFFGDALEAFTEVVGWDPMPSITAVWDGVKNFFSALDPLGPIVAAWDTVQAAWDAGKAWLEAFDLGEAAGTAVGTMVKAITDFGPLGAIKAGWNTVTTWLGNFSLADEGGSVVGTLLSAVIRFSPLGLIVTAFWQVAQWLGNFSLADPVGKVVDTLLDWVFSPREAVEAGWNAVTTWLGNFSLADGGRSVVGTLIKTLVRFSPLGLIVTAFWQVAQWLGNFSLADPVGKVVGTLLDWVFSPREAIEAGWQAVKDWLPTFKLGGDDSILGGMLDAVTAFNPLGAIQSAWNTVTGWMPDVDLGTAGTTIMDTLRGVVTAFNPLGAIKSAWNTVTGWARGRRPGHRRQDDHGHPARRRHSVQPPWRHPVRMEHSHRLGAGRRPGYGGQSDHGHPARCRHGVQSPRRHPVRMEHGHRLGAGHRPGYGRHDNHGHPARCRHGVQSPRRHQVGLERGDRLGAGRRPGYGGQGDHGHPAWRRHGVQPPRRHPVRMEHGHRLGAGHRPGYGRHDNHGHPARCRHGVQSPRRHPVRMEHGHRLGSGR